MYRFANVALQHAWNDPAAFIQNYIYIRDARDERRGEKIHIHSDTERMYNERTHVRADIKYVGVSTHTHIQIQHQCNSRGWEKRSFFAGWENLNMSLTSLTMWEIAIEKALFSFHSATPLSLHSNLHLHPPFLPITFCCYRHNCVPRWMSRSLPSNLLAIISIFHFTGEIVLKKMCC